MEEEDPRYVDDPLSPLSPEGEFEDAPQTLSDLDGDVDAEGEVVGGEG